MGIRSETIFGDGGNITLNIKDLLLFRNGLRISTDAGTETQGGNGGNITINIPDGFIVAIGDENSSDISANAFNGTGGNVVINAEGIFGMQFREVGSPETNDITATGANSQLSGNVELNTTEVDPTSALVELPVNLVDRSNQISNACTPGSPEFENTFVSTGRGGLPISPTEPLQENNTLSAWVRLKPQAPSRTLSRTNSRTNKKTSSQPTTVSNTPKVQAKNQIVEATGWIVDADGNIEFVAHANQINPRGSWQNPASCSVSK